jgi:hypothetical protein
MPAITLHLHPFDNPAQHIPGKAISFAEFLSAVEDRFLDDR